MKSIVFLVLGVALLVGLWFFASPLFIDETVDERFDLLLESGDLDMRSVMAMADAERRAMMDDIMQAAANAPDRPAADSMPMTAPRRIARGEFVDADAIHKGSGSATLYALPNGGHLLRFEDFRTTNGPALVVYLAKHGSPARADDVTDGGFIRLGKLKGNVGNQNYPIPAGTNVAEYGSVVIWCELFGVLFSPAALSRT